MAALFDAESGSLTRPSTVEHTFEIRRVPFVQNRSLYLRESDWTEGPAFLPQFNGDMYKMLQDMFYNLDTDWMFTAILQAAFNGPRPPWTQDDWSFVPLLFPSNTSVNPTLRDSSDDWSPTNLTFQTRAIRARIECSSLDWPSNPDSWLTKPNSTITRENGTLDITMFSDNYRPAAVIYAGNTTTRLTAQANDVQCCANLSNNDAHMGEYAPTVLAYWTENWSLLETDPNNSRIPATEDTLNFTVKWIRGPALFEPPGDSGFGDSRSYLAFPERPAIQALNCMPMIETSRAEVTIEPSSGVVQRYRILEDPTPDNVAWSDSFQYRNLTDKPHFSTDDEGVSDTIKQNVDITTRYVGCLQAEKQADSLLEATASSSSNSY
jgi:hypothetical protein